MCQSLVSGINKEAMAYMIGWWIYVFAMVAIAIESFLNVP